MDEKRCLPVSEAQGKELTALVQTEMERRLEAIHDLLSARYTAMGGYKAPEVWAEVKAKIVALVGSDLANLGKGLALLAPVPAEEAGKN